MGKNGKPVVRPYTPVSPSDKEGELAFLIKRYEAGAMSQHIHALKPGDKLGIMGPIMKIPYKSAHPFLDPSGESETRHVLTGVV